MKHISKPGLIKSLTLLLAALTGVVFAGAAAAAGDQETTAPSAQADIVIFGSKEAENWPLFIGTESNWNQAVKGDETSNGGHPVVSVQKVAFENGPTILEATWHGGTGQVYWQRFERTDVSEIASAGGALSVVARIDRKPTMPVSLRMGCGFPCGGSLNMEQLFGDIPEGDWFRASFELECFESTGAVLDRINAPLIVMTDGEFKLSIIDVRITANPAPESLISCD
jgi:beta-glucosidase